ncbi:MAG: pantoate--beta-alanine ligase [FCB group bacterium]|nr:pantoate--beta-alanine ligase [FCB group bacterium]
MVVVDTVEAWRSVRENKLSDGTLGFVPTMGALHPGHLSLVARSIQENEYTVVSIFLNPTQFDDPGDLQSYPQTLEQDRKVLQEIGADVLFLPEYGQLYPDDYRYKVVETSFSHRLCGAQRPGHFDGVLTVVMKLLNIIRADKAYFGEKDYQQYQLVRDMARAFFLSTEIVVCPIVRESDGLAASSRNRRLGVKEREIATLFYHDLNSGQSVPDTIRDLESHGFTVDYVEDIGNRRYGAVVLGKVRLIDNVVLPEQSEEAN